MYESLTNEELLDAFEAGELGAEAFPHARHVRVAWALARTYGPEEGFRRLVEGIRGIATRAGRADAFHLTITRAWFDLIAPVDDLAEHEELFDRGLLARYYSAERLAAGRDEWLEPDLHALRLPPPPLLLELPAVLRRVPAAVAVLAVRTRETVHATTLGSLTSVSREPALVGTT